jgi:histone H1/5
MSAPAAAPAPKATKPKAPKKPSAHPPSSEMVMKAIVTLKERQGSSLPGIKKYISANYKVRA